MLYDEFNGKVLRILNCLNTFKWKSSGRNCEEFMETELKKQS